MSEFKAQPKLTLPTREALLSALTDTSWFTSNETRFNVKSDWLCDLIREIEKSGQYPYNAVVQREAEKRLGIDAQDDSGSPLSMLVYCAQGYRRHDDLVAQGYTPLTETMLREAFESKAQIELHSTELIAVVVNGMKQTHQHTRLNVREIGGKLYAMKPKKRKWAVQVQGQPAKIVKRV